jgi:hypothetical protein
MNLQVCCKVPTIVVIMGVYMKKNIVGALRISSVMLALGVLVSLPLAHVSAQPQPSFNLQKAKAQQPKILTLAHPVAARDALTLLKNQGNPEQEIEFKGSNILGGFMPNLSKSVDAQVKQFNEYFQNRYHMIPAISAIKYVPNADTQRITSIAMSLKNAKAVTLAQAQKPADPKQATKVGKPSQVRPMDAQQIPDYYPTTMWGEMYDNPYTDDGTVRADYSIWIDYLDEWGFTGDPTTFPDDWGLEYGVTSYNPNITGTIRPLCGLGGDTDFWSTTYHNNDYTWTAFDIPEAAAPYADYNIETDSCKDNSVEVGLGYPQALGTDSGDMNVTIDMAHGSESSSPASVKASMVSNDCNDIGAWPGSNCMGLQYNRQLPAGYYSPQEYVNPDHGWTIPGCFAMQDEMDEPNLSC